MLKNPSLSEFEQAITMRVLCDRLVDHKEHLLREFFSYDEAFNQSVFAANDILREIGINRELWVRVRGKRAYIFNEQNRRIALELGIITDEAGRGLRRRLQIKLIGRRALPPTIGDLAVETARLGKFKPGKRRQITNQKGERR
jgi:hypothetical protein